MAAIRDEELISAIQNRRQHIIKNSSSLTLKGFRALLENDLKLPHKTLNNEQHKKTVERKVDQILAEHLKKTSSKNTPASANHSDAVRQKKKKAEARPPKRVQTEGSPTRKPAKKAKTAAEPAQGSSAEEDNSAEEKAKPVVQERSARAKKLLLVCKHAGIKIPPNVYKKNKTSKELEAAVAELLAAHGLSLNSGPHEISRAAKEIEKAKELEGINTTNIIEGGRRSRPRVNYSEISKPQYEELSSSDEEEEEAPESSPEAESPNGSNAENEQPANGSAEPEPKSSRQRRKAAKKTKPSLSGSESEGSEEEKAQASDAGDAAEPKSSSEQDSETEGNAKQLSGKLEASTPGSMGQGGGHKSPRQHSSGPAARASSGKKDRLEPVTKIWKPRAVDWSDDD